MTTQKAPIARRMFELYATGRYSLSSLGKRIQAEFGVLFGKGYLDNLLKNPFYAGSFRWEDKIYPGTHTPLVDRIVFEQVQAVFTSHPTNLSIGNAIYICRDAHLRL